MLKGVRVLDLSRLLPGPYASMLLADQGAEVIKVEDVQGGDGLRTRLPPAFAATNRHKHSIALDLGEPNSSAICLKLAAKCDVLLESFRPGVMKSLGLGYADVAAVNPRIVYASLTGWGQTGPLRNRAGHDLNYLAVAGVLGITGTQDAPVIPGVQMADLGGGLLAAFGIVSALHQARTTGHGTHLDVAMYDLLLSWLTLPGAMQTAGNPVGRGNYLLNGGVLCYNIYPTADGEWMALAALEPKFWMAFCQAVERPDLLGSAMHPARPGTPGYEQMHSLFLSRNRAEWARLGSEIDCCLSPVLSMGEALRTEQAAVRGMVWPAEQGSPGYPAHPLRTAQPEGRGHGPGPAPALGADTLRLLQEWGIEAAL